MTYTEKKKPRRKNKKRRNGKIQREQRKLPRQGKRIRWRKKLFLIKCLPSQEVNVICLATNILKKKEKKLKDIFGKTLKRNNHKDYAYRYNREYD